MAFERVFAAPWSLPAILAAALLLRIAHLVALRASPFFTALQLDHRAYDEWAQRIAGGDWLGHDVFFVDPLYAYALGGLYALFGHSLLAVRLVQAAIGVATCWLTARIGRRVLGSTALGNLAALIAAAFIPALHYEAAIEKTALSTFLFTLALDRYLASSPGAALAAGVALGLGTLTRGTFLLFVPAGAVALLADHRAGSRSWRRAGLFVAGALAVVSVAAVRNLAVSGELVLSSANLGQNLYIGQLRQNQSGTYFPPPFVRPDSRYEQADFRAEAERRAGHPLGARAVSAYWQARAVVEVRAAPGATLARTWRKLRLFWHQFEVPDNDNLDLVADHSPVLRLPVVWMGTLFPFAVLGAVTGWRRGAGVRVLIVTAGLYCASVLTFFVLARFRAALVPLLSVLAAAGVAWVREAAHARAWHRLAAGAVLLAGAALWAGIYPAWIDAQRRASLAIAYHNLGAAFADAGDAGAAIQAHERAVASDPQVAVGSLRALGNLYLQRGDYALAEQHMQHVLALKPNSRLGRQALARLYAMMRKDPRWRDDPQIAGRLAEAAGAAERGGDTPEASTTDAPAAPADAPAALAAPARAALVARLRREPRETPLWLMVRDGDPGARQLAAELRSAFASAGWSLRADRTVSFPIKPGLYLFAADPVPPPPFTAVREALAAAGFVPVLGLGYREYYQNRLQTKPGFRGFPFDPDQTYVLVVGPQPGAPTPGVAP